MPEKSSTGGACLELLSVARSYRSGTSRIRVLDEVSMVLVPGQRVAITGASGSGKSTLLHLAAGMDEPDRGRVLLNGRELGQLAEPERTRHRARAAGLVFQHFNLIDSLSIRDNIMLPAWINGCDDDAEHLAWLADRLAITDLFNRLPEQLSGGEQQRVAIARALIHRPVVLLADEPTGSLDPATADTVLDLFAEVVTESRVALLMVTHNARAAALCEQVWRLDHGRLSSL